MELSAREQRIFKKLNTPAKIQDFVHRIPTNFEKHGQTLHSPRVLLEKNVAHCMEAALFSAAVLWYHGQPPQLLDLRTIKGDFDHVVALFRYRGRWGAISKSNHAVLLYRDPIYKTVRELAVSYFHEYFLQDGRKTLREYSDAFNLRRFGQDWITAEDDLWHLDRALDKSPHHKLLDRDHILQLRPADRIQIRAGNLEIFHK
ncbi:MAG TPA: hypothetical protein VFX17_00635 [Patescibacteria group bacterium]|nr:hypothetical protein [Patescibacteria group bacterium]